LICALMQGGPEEPGKKKNGGWTATRSGWEGKPNVDGKKVSNITTGVSNGKKTH